MGASRQKRSVASKPIHLYQVTTSQSQIVLRKPEAEGEPEDKPASLTMFREEDVDGELEDDTTFQSHTQVGGSGAAAGADDGMTEAERKEAAEHEVAKSRM